MKVEIPDEVAPYVAAAIRQFARQLARDGFAPPPGLAAFADLLRDGDRDVAARRRALSAARSARYRARQRAEAAARPLAG